MKIRSITYFMNIGWPLKEERIQQAGAFLAAARTTFENAGYEVQTVRIANVPFPQNLGADAISLTPRFAQKISNAIAAHGIDYASLGPAIPEMPESYEVIPDAIAASKNIFFSGITATRKEGVHLPALRACADIIIQNASISPDGFANLRFTALANVNPGGPFFPGSYHDSDQPTFALAIEAADLAVDAFDQASSITEARALLTERIENHARKLAFAADPLKYRFNVKFGGIDISLAPFPSEEKSIGTAFEKLGASQIGQHGSLASACILTDALDQADFPRAGFNGLMMPVLEDATLAKRAASGVLTVKDLLMYSAVCGCGLDTVPLPGDISVGQVSALLLDISSMALRLNKPLTGRLMPIPGKKAGDETNFNFDFFANSRVMALEADVPMRLFTGNGSFTIQPRNSSAITR